MNGDMIGRVIKNRSKIGINSSMNEGEAVLPPYMSHVTRKTTTSMQ